MMRREWLRMAGCARKPPQTFARSGYPMVGSTPFREIGTSSFICLDSNPHSSVDFPAKENRKPSVTAPKVSPPVQHLLASKKLVGLARWSAKPGYVLFVALRFGD